MLAGKDMSHVYKLQEFKNLDTLMKEFETLSASASPKAAFLLLFSKCKIEDLMAAGQLLEAKSTDGGRTDKKIDAFIKLILGNDMNTIDTIFKTSAAFIEAIEVSVNLAFERQCEKEKFNISNMKKLLNAHIMDRMKNDMTD